MLYTANPLEREDKLFYPTRLEVIRGTYLAWMRVLDSRPTKLQLGIKVAHWAAETGWFKAGLHWFNLNNAKSNLGRPHTFFKCSERDKDGSTVYYKPPHIQTCFQVFDTLEDGLVAAIAFLALDTTPNNGVPNRYEAAWLALMAENLDLFCSRLGKAGFYTDDPEHYRGLVAGCLKILLQSSELDQVMGELTDSGYADDLPQVEPPDDQVHSPATPEDISIAWAEMQVPWGDISDTKVADYSDLNKRWD